MSNYNCGKSGRGRARILVLVVTMLISAYAADVTFSGKWLGSSPDMGAMCAVLKQEGTTLTGSAGPSEAKQFPITTGKVEGDRLTFEVKMAGGTIRFDLTSTTSELRGTMRLFEDDGNTASASVVLKRVP
jgi:hypothetical protein